MSAFIEEILTNPVNLVAAAISVIVVVAGVVYLLISPKMVLLAVKNLRRNLVRTLLTSAAVMVLVMMITLIWTVVYFLDVATTEKAADFKLIVTERWQLPSQMPMTHAHYLDPDNAKFLPELKGLYGPNDFMTWSFYGGTTDPEKMSLENLAFLVAMNPKHIRTMMDDLENFDPAIIKKMQDPGKPEACLLSKERMDGLNIKVGNRFKLTSINYKGVDLTFEVVGELPQGRYDKLGIMTDRYFNDSLDKYARDKGTKHPLDQKRLALIWMRVRDQATFNKVGEIVEHSPYFADRPVKCETASSGIGAFLDAYRDIIKGVKYVLVPAILISMALVVANAISITVRERRNEMAVLKVLGFRPVQILCLVLGESLLIGCTSGLLAAGLTREIVNLNGGLPFPIVFFPAFIIPGQAIFWGLAMGTLTAFLGSFLPAWKARSVKVSEVFAKVA